MSAYKTEQEAFWAGQFGDDYIERNKGERLLQSNIALFSSIMERCGEIHSAIELGANIGINLAAIHAIIPQAKLTEVEINERAVASLRCLDFVETVHGSLLEYAHPTKADLAFTKTVLIHIDPEELVKAYAALYESTSRFVLVAEYYNPTPVEVSYRGHERRLFKRDFAGDLLDRYEDLRLVDYGFSYHRAELPQDDITWFLLEKVTS